MTGSWLAPSVEGKVRRWRFLLLACITCGLIQKPLIYFAWDVITFSQVLVQLFNIRASSALIGGTAIWLRQAFAMVGQKTVAKLAIQLHKHRSTLGRLSLKALLKELLSLAPADAGKRQGRMARYSGPRLVKEILSSNENLKAFSSAACVVGRMFTTSVVTEKGSLFHKLCHQLKHDQKLPLVGLYSSPHIVRACAVAREAFDGWRFDVSDDAWTDDLRAMHKDRTQAGFDSLGVFSRGDAQDMQKTVVGVARHCFSYRTAARFGKLALFDLPCQVCELAGVLGQVKTHLGTRGCGVADHIALEWLLKRLPGKVSHMTALSRSLKVERCRARGAGNGLDLQCAGNVAKSWLTRGPPALQKSMWHLFLLGRSDPFQAPTLHCAVCVGQLGDAVSSGHRKTCDACRRAHRQSWDRQRQQLNRK